MTKGHVRDLLTRLCAEPGASDPVSRVVLVAAHPDDEVISAGARLPHWPGVQVVHVTDGAPRDMRDATAAGFVSREDYARARRRELLGALALAGVAPDQARGLGRVDQEASLDLAGLAEELADLFRALAPEVVVAHPYEGGHPDHDAAAFAVHATCRLLEGRGAAVPALVEMTSYHNGPAGIVTGEFLPADGAEVVTLVLSEQERQFKRRLLDCHATQRSTLRHFPLGPERFRPAPRYDFTRAPHEGRLFYEQFDWGMDGARWRELASAALTALRLRG